MKRVNGFVLVVSSLTFASLPAVGQDRAAMDNGPRVSITTQGLVSTRSAGPTVSSKDEFEALTHEGERDDKRSAIEQRLSAGSQAPTVNTDFWFYDAFITLFSDTDRDGYFTGIELEFDADTIYAAADVYAVAYLSYEYGPWNEYASTEDFSLLGATSSDEYTIETELVSGYPAGSYDILIELFDDFRHGVGTIQGRYYDGRSPRR